MTGTKPPQENKPPTDEEISQICRTPALRFSKEMVKFANGKFGPYAPFWAPLVAAFTTHNVLLISLLEAHEAGSEEGVNAINTFFDGCKFEVTHHWRSEHIKNLPSKRKLSIIP
jgi:hypothetical protein